MLPDFPLDNFPILQTERLTLRKIAMADAADLFQLRSNKEVMQYLARPIAKAIEDAEELIAVLNSNIELSETITWGICEKNHSNIIGTIGYYRVDRNNYRGEIGYLLGVQYWNKGLISEAIKTIVNYGFNTLQFHSIKACVSPFNIASQKVLLKNGFQLEGHYREDCYFEGKFLDTLVYGRLANDA
jgi:ribosomal-protein-alanine N-acetyltransferase